jgi:hypothetical protein
VRGSRGSSRFTLITAFVCSCSSCQVWWTWICSPRISQPLFWSFGEFVQGSGCQKGLALLFNFVNRLWKLKSERIEN